VHESDTCPAPFPETVTAGGFACESVFTTLDSLSVHWMPKPPFADTLVAGASGRSAEPKTSRMPSLVLLWMVVPAICPCERVLNSTPAPVFPTICASRITIVEPRKATTPGLPFLMIWFTVESPGPVSPRTTLEPLTETPTPALSLIVLPPTMLAVAWNTVIPKLPFRVIWFIAMDAIDRRLIEIPAALF